MLVRRAARLRPLFKGRGCLYSFNECESAMLYSFCGMPVGRSDDLSRLEGMRQESGARARMQHPTLVYARSDDSMHLVTTRAPGERLKSILLRNTQYAIRNTQYAICVIFLVGEGVE